MYKLSLLVAILAVGFTACKQDNAAKFENETLEIYSTKGSGNAVEKDSLEYLEKKVMENARVKHIEYFYSTGLLKGREVMLYSDKDGSAPIGSNFVDPDNKPMSYYKFINNSKGQKIASFAFDASNDELLRVEKYEYDKKGFMKVKQIYRSDFLKEKTYAFTHDSVGNEITMSVYGANDSLVVAEAYTVIKADANKKWTERWSFVNGNPKTMHRRLMAK
jgi:hypothetical protein